MRVIKQAGPVKRAGRNQIILSGQSRMFTANVPSLQHTIISYSCTSKDLDNSTTKE